MKKKKRLLWQLYPSYLLIIVITMVAAAWFASRTLNQFYLEQNAADLEDRARLFEAQISEYLESLDVESIDRLCKKIGPLSATRLTVILPSGKVIGDSTRDPATMDNHVDRPEIIQAIKSGIGMSTRYSRTLQKDMMYVGIALKKNSHIIGVVRTSVPLISIDKARKKIEIVIALGSLLIAVLAAVLSLLVSRRITRPIEEIKKAAEGFARGDFERRLPITNSEELGSLAETMNQMAVELREQINSMRKQQNELEAVLSSMVEGIIAVDNEERIISVNQAAAQMLEINPADIQNRSIQEVVRNTDLQNFVIRALASDETLETDFIFHGDSELILNGHSSILTDGAGEGIGALIVLNDVTQLRRLENIRKDFVANVSHEIKTPLTAIKGFVETLRDGAMGNPDDADRFLMIIESHVERLSAIIEDLLSLSRIEQEVEKEEVVLSENPIKDVLLTAAQVCQVNAVSKDIRILVSCEEDLKARINAPLLEQAVVNLLDNAIKYSEKAGEINVEARQADNETIISVRDHGCGIDKEHLDRLFERFYRVDKARSRKLGGTGLGLAIVKHITQAHQGYVEVESVPKKGSTFSLHLPRV